ncbi:peptide chain release factor N(5)-glutamine methyltransferase [Flammeovirga agarivorans]|uniref:peptide chain release factor N(5)-glutamine methyltransferase n=1 Tax=Flammeovirga agarivorans TaxID=2726742 RepID=A0A7X8XVD3_9BACT|nr:peptide chain release factor N(5)-glutamine methyltransferase [Flammeovirga agarivorans]NLR91233.1 peptide chain release factor N(5)-glutamine methyltransferase [Flammeovirga agarivorans]
MTAKEIHQLIYTSLETVYDENEANSIAYLWLEKRLQLSRTDVILQKEAIDFNKELFQQDLKRLQKHEPIQYIIGEGDFYGRVFQLNKDTLIPRSETEELVHLILQENKSGQLLDIGTGSGCIPITIGLESDIITFGIDVSASALTKAKENAHSLNSTTKFQLLDILEQDLSSFDPLDIIVSNPPYVTYKEKEVMDKNVVEFEPELALYVEDDNPLIFYRRISMLASQKLTERGKLYFEINEQFGQETADLMKKDGFKNIEIIKDFQGKDRIVKGIL